MMKIFGLVLIGWMCVAHCSAQSVWERLESWEQSINEVYSAIDVDVVMRDASNDDKILDRSTIKVIRDNKGFYAKLFGFELIAEGALGITVDHLDKKIKVSSAESIEGQASDILRMKSLAALSEIATISKAEGDDSILFKLLEKEEGELLLELEFELHSNKLVKMRQPIQKRIEVDNQFYNAIVEMNYSYPKTSQRPEATSFVAEKNGDWSCRPSYKSYELLAN